MSSTESTKQAGINPAAIMGWGVIALKILTAFFTVPSNKLALGIDSWWQLETLGLVVFEFTFIGVGWVISHGWAKGSSQVKAAWVTMFASTAFLMGNMVVANFLRLAEVEGADIPTAVMFYRMWIAAPSILLLPIVSMFVVFFDALQISGRAEAASTIKVTAEEAAIKVRMAETEAEVKNIELEAEADRAKAKADGQRARMEATKAQLESDTELAIQKISLETELKKQIATMRSSRLSEVVGSKAFKDKLNREVNKDLQALMQEYFGEGESGTGNA